MARFLVVLIAAAAALVLASPANAVDPLPLASASPADGATVPPTPTGGVPWRVAIAGLPEDAQVAVTVSTSRTTGPDGVTLATGDRVDFFFLTAAAPGTYTGASDPGPNAWSAVARPYVWQVTATWTDASGTFHSAASPIERLVIGTPPPAGAAQPSAPAQAGRTTLAMSALDAPYYVRQVIRRHTKRAASRLHYGCARLTSRAFRCRPTWRDSRNTYSAVVATFTHARSGGRIVARATVTGRRASRACTRTRTVARCGRAFRWRSVIAARPLGTR